jgi:hypothetical protein
MATFVGINDFPENMNKYINTATGVFTYDLCSTVPTDTTDATADGNGIAGNTVPIAYTNHTDDLAVARIFTTATLTKATSSGVFTFDYGADVVITAAIGSLPSWQYLTLFDDAPTSPVDPLLGYWDHGSAIVLALAETATIAVNASGFYTVT